MTMDWFNKSTRIWTRVYEVIYFSYFFLTNRVLLYSLLKHFWPYLTQLGNREKSHSNQESQLRKSFICSQMKSFDLRQQQNSRVLWITVEMIPFLFTLEKRYGQNGMIPIVTKIWRKAFFRKIELGYLLRLNISSWYLTMYPS